MDKQVIQDSIQKFSFNDKSDRINFEREVVSLFENNKLKPLVRKNTLQALKELFRSIAGEQSTFLVALNAGIKKKEPLYLLPFFETIFVDEVDPSIQPNALEVFIFLCSKIIESEHLSQLLKSGILKNYTLDRLQSLKHFYLPNLKILIEVYNQNKNDFSEQELLLIFDLLHLLYPTTLDENSSIHLRTFVKDKVPEFIDRFNGQIEKEELLKNVDRFAEWFMVWRRHLLKEEENIGKDHEYYQQEFSKIIKYITEFIWWNNGLYYSNGDKNYHFGSEGFIHLAIGGSIRKAPDRHHFTRRMAKVFVTLPFDFDQSEKDMYIYCYGKSLNAGPLLLEMLQEFMRHSPNHIELESELEKWNPVIQKLACEEFESLTEQVAVPFMGYLYHCMRDKVGFTVQRRTVGALLRDSIVYQERIAARANQRLQAQRLREERRIRRREEVSYWTSSDLIKPYEYKNYAIVELLNKNALAQEGNILNHCVGSYYTKCKKNISSIWSLRRFENKKWFRCVTIEILNRQKEIVQMSARFNASPSKEHKFVIETWAKREKIKGFGIL